MTQRFQHAGDSFFGLRVRIYVAAASRSRRNIILVLPLRPTKPTSPRTKSWSSLRVGVRMLSGAESTGALC